jgi:4-hydroxybenzoate polyprenyltransferase
MTSFDVAPPSTSTLLRLGRVSNLPTVWTNVLAGAVLADGEWRTWRLCLVLLAMSLLYAGGMFLNDYFDRAIDARERPERPIPVGAISATAVALIGFGLLSGGVLATALMGALPGVIALLLGALIVAYDLHHKQNALSPVLMGLCRALVYLASAAALSGSVPLHVAISAAAMAAYVAGLTYAARQESLDRIGNLWPLVLLCAPLLAAVGALQHGPSAALVYMILAGWVTAAAWLLAKRPYAGSVGRAVRRLIAGISLVDAVVLASFGAIAAASVAIGGFAATLISHKFVAGT